MPMSAKVAAYTKEYRAAAARVRARSGGRCEFTDCENRSVHCHHKRRRSQGGTNDDGNLVDLCLAHHEHIHANPAWSAERGWIVMSKA